MICLLLLKIEDRLHELFRYALVGIVSNFAGYMVYLLITYLGYALDSTDHNMLWSVRF